MTEQPNLMETAFGGFFQDIGKFMQRAHGAVRHMDPQPRARESVILPPDGRGGYTHKHVLWTEAFFHWMEQEGLHFPSGISRDRVRDMAVFHHLPDANGALGWLAAEADRLSSGMDRKPRDYEAPEAEAEYKGWDAFIKTPLRNIFGSVDLGLGDPPLCQQPLSVLIPDERLLPEPKIRIDNYQKAYRDLWDHFTAEFKALCGLDNRELFCEGLLSLSERFTFAIPSSTVDVPDVSLHDHNRTVAAIAACLHCWHEVGGTLDNEQAIRNRATEKFYLLAGDLSGIQHTLFLLANQQVKGVNKILRARSLLLGMTVEAAALRCRREFGLPAFNLIQNAGGRFVLLLPALPEVQEKVTALQAELDDWLGKRYLGELALNLALSPSFGGHGLQANQFSKVQSQLNRALDTAKQQALRHCSTGILPVRYEQEECTACGKRPARHRDSDARRCDVCHDEHRVGGWLPKADAISWQNSPSRSSDWSVELLPGKLWLNLHEKLPGSTAELLSGFRLYRGEQDTPAGPWPLRFVAAYVPRLNEGEARHPLYARLSDEAQEAAAGELKTFEHLAQDALELERDGTPLGKPFLAVLKADVDRLGFIFGFGLRDPSDSKKDRATLSRYASLSRMLDLFFTGYLQERLRRDYPHTYTVYAGGDDLLLIGPWRQMIALATDLREQFRRYVGGNPNITLSAGLALCRANQPLNRTVWEAEERLEQAKDAGRDRVGLLDEQPVTWEQLPALLRQAETLNEWLRAGWLNTALVYKVLRFAEERRRAEQPDEQGNLSLAHADWRARWAYHLARNVRDSRTIPDPEKKTVATVLNQLLGLDADIRKQAEWVSPRIPVSIALYRNR
ncbi:MAG: type III-A CRISPR-associated protein Cas10/Csm1 [Candidatus Competibacter sp.]|nr:type III-A CRISPR-associated protein Cas10/Csm1 [Candidatus Competibacteraceae bacterium]MBL8253004.1 type III-A CRISPR-associated protein Cas10/Csm1 [Candidatus Competibacter sp.]